MEITNLARDIANALRHDGRPAVSSEETLDEFVQLVLDKVESLGGFDLTAYEDDDDDEDDLWDDDEDEDDRDDESDRWGDDDELPSEDVE